MDPWVTQAFSYTPEMELSFNDSPISCRVGVPILTFWVNPVSRKNQNKNRNEELSFLQKLWFFWIFILNRQKPYLLLWFTIDQVKHSTMKKKARSCTHLLQMTVIPRDQKQLQLRYQNYHCKMKLQRKTHRCNDHSISTNRCILCQWSVSKSPNMKSWEYVDESMCLTFMDSDHSESIDKNCEDDGYQTKINGWL